MAEAEIVDFGVVRAMLADAEPVASVPRLVDDPSPGQRNAAGVEAGKWEPDALGLPKDCPVKPLGVIGSNTGVFLDTIGQIHVLAPPYGKGHILGLFGGRMGYLCWGWPRHGKDGTVQSYAAEKCAADLMQACFAKGPWEGVERVRGRGAWRTSDGNVLVHVGTQLIVRGRREPPGEIDGHVYPTRPPMPRPFPEPVPERQNPARLLLPLFRTWAWKRPDHDPTLLLGWIAGAMVGGALPWRPIAYLTGGAGTGKSTLQHVIKSLFGDGLLQLVDTSAAGIYQNIGQDSLPVSVDEFEGEEHTGRSEAVIKLARQACSGGLMARGGDRHNPIQFRVRSAFIFSSINTPPLRPQDLSRMAILRIGRVKAGLVAPRIGDRELSLVGRMLMRRMLDQWPRFEQTWQAFRGALAEGGLDARGQDTFGTLLACADMAEHDGWSEERLRVPTEDGDLVPLSELYAASRLEEYEDRRDNWRACLSRLLGTRVEAWRSTTRHVVGQVLEDHWRGEDDVAHLKQVNKQLAAVGLAVVRRADGSRWLAVPTQGALVRQLFQGSEWGGASDAGVWTGALRQSERGVMHDVGVQRINGDRVTCTMISLAALYGEGGIMDVVEEIGP